jgi:transcriptional regulator with XRE-family HTH domain
MSNIFGEKLKKLRELRGIAKTELSRRLGHKSDTYIYDVEKGVFLPPAEKLREIAKALEVPPSLLEEMALEAKIEELGIKDPSFIGMFKDYPRLSRKDKGAIVAAYLAVKRTHGPYHR